MFQERFANGIYRDCPFCRGKGCLACPAEANKEYKRQFPDGPKPLATFTAAELNDPKTKELIGADALSKHFGAGGGGMTGFVNALRAAGKLEE